LTAGFFCGSFSGIQNSDRLVLLLDFILQRPQIAHQAVDAAPFQVYILPQALNLLAVAIKRALRCRRGFLSFREGELNLFHLRLSQHPLIAVPFPQIVFQAFLDKFVLSDPHKLLLQASQSWANLIDNVRDTFEVSSGCFKPAQCFFFAGAVKPDPRRFLEQFSAFIRSDGKREVHQALPDDCVCAVGKTSFSQQFMEVLQTHLLVVDQVFVLPVAISPSCKRDFGVINRQPAGLIIKSDRNRCHPCPGASFGPGIDHVFGLLGTQHCVGLLTQNPSDRIGYIGLSRSIGSNDCRDSGRKYEVGLFCESLIPVQFKGG